MEKARLGLSILLKMVFFPWECVRILKIDDYRLRIIIRSVCVKISIEYCTQWNYKPRASSLEDELNKEFDADIVLIASSDGVYEIVVDGKNIFSKKTLNRFPEDGEIVTLIRSWSYL